MSWRKQGSAQARKGDRATAASGREPLAVHIYESDKKAPGWTPKAVYAAQLVKDDYRGSFSCPVCSMELSRAKGNITTHFRKLHLKRVTR